MKAKWKHFAIEQVLSNWSAKVDPEILFDWIRDTEDEALVSLFDDYDISVWQPFEDWPLTDIAGLIVDLATSAEKVEGEPI